MYPISQTALTKFQSGAMQYARITIESTTITNANIIQGGMSVNRYVSTGESVAVGSCVAAELSLTLNNRDGSWNSFSFDGKEAYVEVGVYTSSSTITYIPFGYFIIDEVKFDRNTVTLTALDRLVRFDGAIDETQFTFPYTLKTLLARLCAICGVTLGTTGNFTNYSYYVAALPSEAKTYRDVLRWICELSGTNGYIKYDGKLYIEWYSTTSGFTITTANRTQSEVDENTFSLTGVTLIQDETRYTAGTSTRPIIIQDNPLVSTNPQTLVNNLNTKLNGFSWCPFNAVILPAPHLFPMDRCTFTKKDGTNVAVSITGVTYKLNGNTSIAGSGDKAHKGRSYGLQDATFYAANIAAGAITADKISAGAVKTDKLDTGAVTTEKINVSVDMATNAGVASTYATKATAASQEQRIYYRKSTTGAPTAPTTWVTATATANESWTLKRMPYSQSYPYLYTCIQRKTVSGAVSNSTVLLDDTTTVIDGGNIITGTVTANAIATGTITATKLADDAVVVGGRNLALRTATMPTSGTPSWNISIAGTKSTVDIVDAPISGITNAVRVTNGTTEATRCGISEGGITGIVVGKMYSVSGWLRASTAGLTIDIRAIWSSSGATSLDQSYTTTTTWQYVKFEGSTLTSSTATSFSVGLFHVSNLPVNGWFELCGVKVEEGNKATAWSPAPEDAEAYADDTFATKAAAATDTHRIYYRSNSNSAPTAPTTWVTSTTTNNATWSVKRMAADPNNVYKYIWTCTQIKAVNGTIANSTVLLDDTTTVIDGGNIITGTVTANQISVSDLQALNATIAGWSLDSSRIFKEVTIGDYVYQVYMSAPASPAAGNLAVGIRKRATNSETWSYPCYFNYGGDFYATNAHITGGDVSGSTVGTGVNAGNLTTGTLDAARIAAGSLSADKISVTDLQAFGATIAGWSISNTLISKSFTIDGVTYRAYMQAKGSDAVAANGAFVIARTENGTTTYPFLVRYNGKLEATNADISGKITSSNGTIGGWNIGETAISKTVSGKSAVIRSDIPRIEMYNPNEQTYSEMSGTTGIYTEYHLDDDNNGFTKMYGREFSQQTDIWEVHATWADWFTKNTTSLLDGTLTLKGKDIDPDTGYLEENFKTAQLTYKDLTFNGTSIFDSTAKVKQTATTTSASYPLLFGESLFTQNTQVTTKTEGARISGGIFVNPNTATINARRIHSTTSSQYGRIVLGNALKDTVDTSCSHGEIYVYGKSDKYVRIADVNNVLTAHRTIYFPDQSGTFVLDAVTSGSMTGTSNVSNTDCTWTKTGKMVRLSGTFYFNTSTSVGTLFTGLPVPASEMTINVLGQDNYGASHEQLCITTSGEIVFNSTGTHSVDQSSRFQFDTTYIAASL